MIALNAGVLEMEPEEIEALLPWHAAGTLNARDARRVDDALARDPNLAKQFAVIQNEFAETILLNESLGAPSARAMQNLFAAIDAEPSRKPAFSLNLAARIAGFFDSLSPRTLAYSATAGAVALLLQAGVIGAVLIKDKTAGYETASFQGAPATAGAIALVRFAPDARVADITAFLDSYKATIVDGVKAGMFRLQFGDQPMSREETASLMAKLQSEKIVSFVAAAQ
jgi:anti-sigma factor RsiW